MRNFIDNIKAILLTIVLIIGAVVTVVSGYFLGIILTIIVGIISIFTLIKLFFSARERRL